MLFTTFALFAAVVGGAYAAPVSGGTVIQAPSGSGQIIVSQTQLRVTGCLNAEGLWNVAGDCATFSGEDDGSISGPEGYLAFTEDSGITTSPTSDTTWLGYYLNGNVSFEHCPRDKVHAQLGTLCRHPPHMFLPTKLRSIMLLEKSCVSIWVTTSAQAPLPPGSNGLKEATPPPPTFSGGDNIAGHLGQY